jgi:hypothetical protein
VYTKPVPTQSTVAVHLTEEEARFIHGLLMAIEPLIDQLSNVQIMDQ